MGKHGHGDGGGRGAQSEDMETQCRTVVEKDELDRPMACAEDEEAQRHTVVEEQVEEDDLDQ
jgi:hypothetical protein